MKGSGTRWLLDDDNSKQNWQWERPSLSLSLSLPTLSLQGEIGMGGPYSLLAINVSAERQTPRPCLVLRKKPPKKSTRGEFSNYGN